MGTRALFPRSRGRAKCESLVVFRRDPASIRRPRPSRHLVLLGLLPLLLVSVLLLGSCGKNEDLADLIQALTSTTLAPSTTIAETTSSTEPPFAQEEGEIFLEAAGTPGPESFTGETFVPAGPPSTLNIPTSTTMSTATSLPATTTVAGGGIQVASQLGSAPALYGGSKSKSLVDKEGQLRFLEANPDKAAAFCAALNGDPTFQWSGGTQIQPSQLRQYFAELTPVMLTRDTRVTNHGYRDGRPTPRQSVLQAGQMVLVDRWGVPRVRCECGNPLTPPRAVQRTPRYTGPRWPGFDPTVIIVVQKTTVIIETFVLIDIYTGQTFDRPAGTDGTQDAAHIADTYHLQVEMRWQDPDNKRVSTIEWSADISVSPDGTLTGNGSGTWHSDGTAFDADNPGTVVGSWQADATIGVNITGMVDVTELGPTLRIVPALGDMSVDNLTYSAPGYEHGLQASIESIIPDVIQQAFVELDLSAGSLGPLYASVVSGGYEGSATLTPLR